MSRTRLRVGLRLTIDFENPTAHETGWGKIREGAFAGGARPGLSAVCPAGIGAQSEMLFRLASA